MDELFFNNFSKIDGTNRFSINAGTYCMFSNLTFLFVWTNVYYSYCKMTPVLISDNRFLSSELDLRVWTWFPQMPRAWCCRDSQCPAPVSSRAMQRALRSSLELLPKHFARSNFCVYADFLHWTEALNPILFYFFKWHCWPCSFCLSLQWLCCGEQGCETACFPSSAICLSVSSGPITVQPRRSLKTMLRSA